MGKIANWIITKAKFMPCGAIQLFRYNNDGKTKAVIYHEIDIAFGKYYFRIEKILPRGTRKDPYWKFKNLTDVKI